MAIKDNHYTGGETEGGITSSYATNDGEYGKTLIAAICSEGQSSIRFRPCIDLPADLYVNDRHAKDSAAYLSLYATSAFLEGI